MFPEICEYIVSASYFLRLFIPHLSHSAAQSTAPALVASSPFFAILTPVVTHVVYAVAFEPTMRESVALIVPALSAWMRAAQLALNLSSAAATAATGAGMLVGWRGSDRHQNYCEYVNILSCFNKHSSSFSGRVHSVIPCLQKNVKILLSTPVVLPPFCLIRHRPLWLQHRHQS